MPSDIMPNILGKVATFTRFQIGFLSPINQLCSSVAGLGSGPLGSPGSGNKPDPDLVRKLQNKIYLFCAKSKTYLCRIRIRTFETRSADPDKIGPDPQHCFACIWSIIPVDY